MSYTLSVGIETSEGTSMTTGSSRDISFGSSVSVGADIGIVNVSGTIDKSISWSKSLEQSFDSMKSQSESSECTIECDGSEGRIEIYQFVYEGTKYNLKTCFYSC